MVIFLASSGTGPTRPTALQELYSKFGELQAQTDGPYYLNECDGRQNWPDRGIYLFFTHDSDLENDPPSEWTVARIGTVGVSKGSSNTLWGRLRQHRGNLRGKYSGGGNSRGSIFRLHVGAAMIERDGLHDDYPLWGVKHADWPDDVDTTDVREQEHRLEQRVSEYISSLPFLVLNVPGEPGPRSDRASIEQRMISTFSYNHRIHDLGNDSWLGLESPKPEIYRSRLWNINHVEGFASPDVVYDVDEYIPQTEPVNPETE